MTKNKVRSFNGNKYIVSYPLSITEKGSIVNDIANHVFKDGIYAPHLFDAVCKVLCISQYTDIQFPMFTDDDGNEFVDLDAAFKLINESSIMDDLKDVIDPDIYDSAMSLIEFRKEQYLKRSKCDELFDVVIDLVKKFDTGIFDKFKDVNPKEIMDIANKISNKSEKKIVDEILKFEDVKKKAKAE